MPFELPRPQGDPEATRVYGRALISAAGRLGSAIDAAGSSSAALDIEGPYADRFHAAEAQCRRIGRGLAEALLEIGGQVLRAADILEGEIAEWIRQRQRYEEEEARARIEAASSP